MPRSWLHSVVNEGDGRIGMTQNEKEAGRKTRREKTESVARRNFLKGATLAGAGALAAPLAAPLPAEAQPAAPPPPAPSIPAAPNRQAERGTPPDHVGETQSSSGADFMVDVM